MKVILPKLPLLKSRDPGAAVKPLPANPGNEKFGWFVRLKNSALNSRCVLSEVLNCLKKERSNLRKPGPIS